MRKSLIILICILIMGIVFISGCTSDDKTDSETLTDSQSNEKSDTQNPDLIIKQSDVPGLTLDSYSFLSYPKNAVYDWTPNGSVMEYQDSLPLGYRDVGEKSEWKDQSGREVIIYLSKYESYPTTENVYSITNLADIMEKELEKGRITSDYDWGDPHIGDYSCYTAVITDSNIGIQSTRLSFVYNKNGVTIFVTDEKDKSIKEAIRIAKIIKSRLS